MADSEQQSKDENKVKGALARNASLSPEQRSEIARTAALARWGGDVAIPRASHDGELKIAGVVIPCAVVDGERYISERAVTKALGGRRGGSHWRRRKGDGADLPVYLSANNLRPFVGEDLGVALKSPFLYLPVKGGGVNYGIRAETLPKALTVLLTARDNGKLLRSQEHIAHAADMLLRGLAEVGITALVDEATGYQKVRDDLALQALLDKFLRKELAAWAKRFPDEFYEEIFRLRGWTWKGMKGNRPQVVANYTKDLVYKRLLPGILEELESRNPKDERGRRRNKHHQWLTEDIGHPALAQHLYAVIALMRASAGWTQFKSMLNQALPIRTAQNVLFD